MLPVLVIEGKVRPCLGHSIFFQSRYDKAEFVNDGCLVHMQYTSALSLVITPRGKKFGGKIIIVIACHLVDKF